MELRRSRWVLAFGVVFAFVGLVMLLVGLLPRPAGGLFLVIFGALSLATGAMVVRHERKPFRFGIGPEGLMLGQQLVPWTAIEALVLDQPLPKLHDRSTRSGPYLVLLPAQGSDLLSGRPERTLPDGRAGRLVLELDDVRQSREQIAAALRDHSGGRFADALREAQARIGGHEFSTVPQGYDPAVVDGLVRQAAEALGSGEYVKRIGARARIDNASIPIVDRGYDREQVDNALRTIAKQVAELLPPEQAR
ncbi:hypothetical protein ACQP00_22800 [Dactylosporangium sp. CS-047395]|uniref:hypothetical protein n=1 Tax=Dactylosporangium sp. CS-047395 TaxID=3239936 RepID=UPI003D8B516B